MPNPIALDEFTQLWADAHAKFKDSTGVDPLTDDLAKTIAGCKTSDEVLDKLEDEMKTFKDFRADDSRWGKLRNKYIKPLIDAVLVVNDVAAEATSAVVRPPFTIPAAVLTVFTGDSRREISFGRFRCASTGAWSGNTHEVFTASCS
jgi:hypothetical protein